MKPTELAAAGASGSTDDETRLHRHEGGPARLDRALAEAFPDLSRSRLQALAREGHVRVDDHVVQDPGQKIRPGALLSVLVPPPAPAEPAGETIPLDVVYEDPDLIVIDKPAGLVVHPAAGHASGTLVNALIAHCGASLSGIGGIQRPGIVHRLDKDTSGLLVVAKNDRAHQGLAAQFADHGRAGPLERAYLALVWGVPSRAGGTISAAVGRHATHREKMAVVPSGRGREAITHWSIVERLPAHGEALATLLRCELETGRTHQIRVHMAHMHHPLLGDALYGSGFRTRARRLNPAAAEALDRLGRQALHAAVLGFEHPVTGEALRFESPLPDDMATLLAALRTETGKR
jgi:23S rRNA pseudouridine1911/1915/1917 synthase